MLLGAKQPKQPPSAGDEFAAAAKQWQERWEVQAVRRGSNDAGTGLQAAKALAALTSLAQQAAAHRRGAPQAAVAAACGAALRGVAGPLLSSPAPRVASAALQEVAGIARVAPGAVAFAEVGAAVMRLLAQGGEDGFRAAWLADRCLSAAVWRAGEVWATLSAADGRAALLALMERQASDRNSGVGSGDTDSGPCPLKHHVSLLATLASASDRVAAQLLGATVTDAGRWLRAVAALHASCPFHDPTRDAAVRLVACCCSVPVLQGLLSDAGADGAEARRLVLSVLHSVLRRSVALGGDAQGDVRLWVQAARTATLPQLWRVDPDPDSSAARGGCGWGRPSQQRAEIVAAAAAAVQRPNGESRLSRDVAGAAARLLAAALLCRPDAAAREYGRRPPSRGRGVCSDPLWRAAVADGSGFTLDDGLATVACWASSRGAVGAGGDGDAAASRAAWMLLRVRAAEAGVAAAGAGGLQSQSDGVGGTALAMLMASPNGSSGPHFHVRAHACVAAYVAGAHAAGGQLAAGDQGIRLLAAEAASALRFALETDASAYLPSDSPRLLAAAAWPALACAAERAVTCDVDELGPESAHAAARLAAAVVVAGAAELRTAIDGSNSSGAGRAGSAGDPVLLWEALLAATQALVLLASEEAFAESSSEEGQRSGSSGEAFVPAWRDPSEALPLRAALEVLSSLPLSSPQQHQQQQRQQQQQDPMLTEAAAVEAMVADELRCTAAAALSLCLGQLGVRPQDAGCSSDAPGSGGSSSGSAGTSQLSWALPRDADAPDIMLSGSAGWRLPAHGVVLAAASPVLRQHLLTAAAQGPSAGSGDATSGAQGNGSEEPMQLRLADSVDPLALERLLEWAYTGCLQLPPEALLLTNAAATGAPAAGTAAAALPPRQGLRLLARALQMPGLAALCVARLPLPGERLPRLVPRYAEVALPERGVLLPLGSSHIRGLNGEAKANGCHSSSEAGAHEPSAAQVLAAAHAAAMSIPREALAPSIHDLCPFADVWLGAPVLADSTTTSAGSGDRALLLPAHRLLLAARGPYLAAAASSRWVGTGAAGTAGVGCGASDSGGGDFSSRVLPVIVLPDADAELGPSLLAWLYGADDWLQPQHPSNSSGADCTSSAGCSACRLARMAVRLCHCAEPLLLPALAADVEVQLRTRLLPPLPARCLVALLRDCAELGLAAAAEATFERLVMVLAQQGPNTKDLPGSGEWGALPHHLRQAVEQAVSRQRRVGSGGSEDEEEEEEGAVGLDGAIAAGAVPGCRSSRPAAAAAEEAGAGGLRESLAPLLKRLQAVLP